MPTICRWLLSVAIACVAMPCSTSSAQSTNAASLTGSLPNTSQIGDSTESINASDGTLHIEVPLASVTSRGKTVTRTYVYNTPAFYAGFNVTGGGSDTRSGQAGYWQIHTPQTLDWQQASNIGDWYLAYDSPDPNASAVPCGNDITTGYLIEYKNFVAYDPQGKSHPLDLDWSACATVAKGSSYPYIVVNPKPPTAAQGEYATSGWTLDGSGAFVDLAAGVIRTKDGSVVNSGQPWITSSGQTTTTINPDWTGGYVDRNGNSLPTAPACPGATSSNSSTASQIGFCDAEGNPQHITVAYEFITVQTADCTVLQPYFNAGGSCIDITSPGISRQVVHTITLPNNTYYQFDYASNSHGELTSLRLPTGATITYTYSPTLVISSNNIQSASGESGTPIYYHPTVSQKTISNNGTSTVWNYTVNAPEDQVGTVTVQNPNGDCEIHSTGWIGTTKPVPAETDVNYYSGCNTSGTSALKAIHTDYAYEQIGTKYGPYINVRPIRVTTTIGGVSSKVETDYETFPMVRDDYTVTGMRGNPTEIREFDFGATSPSRVTDYAYLHNVGSSAATAAQYTTLGITDQVVTKTISAPSANSSGGLAIIAKTQNEYDNYTSPITVEPSAAFHDDTDFGSSNVVRGNMTATSELNNTNNSLLTTRYQYDDLGYIMSSADPQNNQTVMGYTDATTDTACLPSGQHAYASLTSVTNALQQKTSMQYSSCVGLMTQNQDPNGSVTTFSYDSVNNLVATTYPDGGRSTTDFGSYSLPLTVTTSVYPDGSTPVSTKTLLDGIGRVTQVTHPDGTTSETAYDAVGRRSYVTNFHTSSTNPTDGAVSYAYDALGRPTLICNQDNGTPAGQCTAGTSYKGYQYNQNTTLETNELGNAWSRTTDGLGRLTTVIEPNQAETDYTYDGLSNLTRVDQWGGAKGSAGDRVRSFTYDSLSRLISATNPENGTVTYTYTAGGSSLCSGDTSSVCTRTDARGVTTTYSYKDPLNRLTGKSYAIPANANPAIATTPAVAFGYDLPLAGWTFPDQTSPSWTHVTQTNLVGRLSYETNGDATLVHGYDALGRDTLRSVCTPSTCGGDHYDMHVLYDKAGAVTFADRGYDAVRNAASPNAGFYYGGLSFTYNSSEQPVQASADIADATHPQLILNAINYDPLGNISTAELGQQYGQVSQYSNRGWVTDRHSVNLSGYTVLADHWDHDVAGNLTDAIDSAQGEFTYDYDTLNRVKDASLPPFAETYSYDPWGNQTAHTLTDGQGYDWNYMPNLQNQSTNPGAAYDAAGNMTSDGNHSYIYDGENRIAGVVDQQTTYKYDPGGMRVATLSGGTITAEYLYDTNSDLVTTVDSSAQLVRTILRMNGLHWGDYIGEAGQGGVRTEFRLVNQVGTLEANGDTQGNFIEGCLSGPFGDGQDCTPTYDYTETHFTDKLRDSESNNDYFGARYFNSILGRFMTPDPSNWGVDFYNPQTWNHYAYVGNNPLSNTDPNGLWLTPTHKSIIDHALPGLSNEQRQILKTQSEQVDKDQSQEGSYKHGMSSEDNDPMSSTGAYNPTYQTNDFIEQNEHDAKEIQADWIASGHTGIAPGALAAFGNAAHTIADEYSPAHTGYQKVNHWTIGLHILRETTLFGLHKQQQQQAAGAIQNAFFDTFGSSAGDQATHEKVTTTIIFDPNQKTPDQ